MKLLYPPTHPGGKTLDMVLPGYIRLYIAEQACKNIAQNGHLRNEVTKQAIVRFPHWEILCFALTTRVPAALNNELLPAQEGICHRINDVPDIGRVSLVQSDCDYVPRRS
jgi:hypothetical protein